MEAASGIDFLVSVAERIIRKNPKYVTIVAPLVTWTFTFLAGTGHIVYPLLPVIYEVAHQNNIPMIAVKVLVSHGESVSFRPHNWLNSDGEPTRTKALIRLLMKPKWWLPVMHRRLTMVLESPRLSQKLSHIIDYGTLEGFDFQKVLPEEARPGVGDSSG